MVASSQHHHHHHHYQLHRRQSSLSSTNSTAAAAAATPSQPQRRRFALGFSDPRTSQSSADDSVDDFCTYTAVAAAASATATATASSSASATARGQPLAAPIPSRRGSAAQSSTSDRAPKRASRAGTSTHDVLHSLSVRSKASSASLRFSSPHPAWHHSSSATTCGPSSSSSTSTLTPSHSASTVLDSRSTSSPSPLASISSEQQTQVPLSDAQSTSPPPSAASSTWRGIRSKDGSLSSKSSSSRDVHSSSSSLSLLLDDLDDSDDAAAAARKGLRNPSPGSLPSDGPFAASESGQRRPTSPLSRRRAAASHRASIEADRAATASSSTTITPTTSHSAASIDTRRSSPTHHTAGPRHFALSSGATRSLAPSQTCTTVESRPPNTMHQTSSRLLRMTDEERPFTRDFKDLFSTLMVSLPLSPHRIRFQRVEHSFTSEEAINNLGSLKFSQSNRMPDPKDPSRIVTTTTTTTFSMAKEMARSVCQRFLDARFIESADGKIVSTFPLKGAVWQLTPKGIFILQMFCQRNGIAQRHVLDVLDSGRNTMQLVMLERDPQTDRLSHDRATVEVLFRRFVGPDGPNTKAPAPPVSDTDSIHESYNGLVGVRMAKERKIVDRNVPNTFTGKAAVDWLMDCCTTVERRETYEIAELFVQHDLIWAAMEDKVFAHQNPAAAKFQPTKNAIYSVTEKGQRVAGWMRESSPERMLDGSNGGVAGPNSSGTLAHAKVNGLRSGPQTRDSNNNRLMVIVNDPALRLLFREYLRETHCDENLNFYLEVREFTKHYDVSDRAKMFTRLDAIRESLAAAYGLYNAFLAPGSPCELNIDHNLRNSLAARMTRAVGDDEAMRQSLADVVGLFRDAQMSVFKLMSSDSVPKFLKDPRHQSILREHNFDQIAAQQAAAAAAAQPVHNNNNTLPERTMNRTARAS